MGLLTFSGARRPATAAAHARLAELTMALPFDAQVTVEVNEEPGFPLRSAGPPTIRGYAVDLRSRMTNPRPNRFRLRSSNNTPNVQSRRGAENLGDLGAM